MLYQKYNDGCFCKIPDNNSHYDDKNSEQESEDEFNSEQEENLKELQDKSLEDFEEINIDSVEFHDFENDNQEEIKYDKHNYPGCYSSHEEYLLTEALDKKWREFQDKLTTPYEKNIKAYENMCREKKKSRNETLFETRKKIDQYIRTLRFLGEIVIRVNNHPSNIN